jgi:hypothetical protein
MDRGPPLRQIRDDGMAHQGVLQFALFPVEVAVGDEVNIQGGRSK